MRGLAFAVRTDARHLPPIPPAHPGDAVQEFGQREPRQQRLELWSLYNDRIHRGEHGRVVPISNRTELDGWQDIAEEGLEVPSICFAHERELFARDGMLCAVSPFVQLLDGADSFSARMRYRTVGDMSCSGAL